MSLSNSAVTLSTGVAVALTTNHAQHVDVWVVPTTLIYIGSSGVAGSSNGITLTTAAPPFHLALWPGDVLWAAPVSSSAITVNVMTRSA